MARPAASTSWYVRFERPPEMKRAVNGGVDAVDVGGDPVGDPRQVDAGADVRPGAHEPAFVSSSRRSRLSTLPVAVRGSGSARRNTCDGTLKRASFVGRELLQLAAR